MKQIVGDYGQYHWTIKLSDGRQVFFTAERIELPGGRLIVPGTALAWAYGEWTSFYARPVKPCGEMGAPLADD